MLADVTNPYGDGNSSRKIIDVLKKIDLKALRTKRFYDIQAK